MDTILDYEGGVGIDDTFKITKFSPVSFSGNVASWSWSGFNNASAVLKVDGVLSNGGSIDVWDEIPIVFENISDDITVTPLEFDGYSEGAVVANIDSVVTTDSYELTERTFLEVENQTLKIKDGYYFDPK